MTVDHYVGRTGEVERLRAVLTGTTRCSGNLSVLSIEGPGGIGKTTLFDHVVETTDLSGRKLLTLRISGNDDAQGTFRAVGRLLDGAASTVKRGKPVSSCFPTVASVTSAYDRIRQEAVDELGRKGRSDVSAEELMRLFDLAVSLGKPLNDMVPATKKVFDFDAIEKRRPQLQEVLSSLGALSEEVDALWERLGLGGATALRNAVRQNALVPLSDAIVSDLSAILSGYRGSDWLKPMNRKIEGLDRLLLVVDDYEKTQDALGEMLVSYVLPGLKAAAFESTVIIIGRDRLEVTSPAWDQHLRANLLNRISLDPLSRAEMDDLVASYGVKSRSERQRAWDDTQGYPFYVQLWVEEADSGGRSAVMLKRFYERTTRWMDAQQKRWLEHALFLDDVNVRTLKRALNHDDEARAAFRWFESEGSVRDTVGASFRVRQYLRSRLIDYLKITDPDRYDELAKGTSSNTTPVD